MGENAWWTTQYTLNTLYTLLLDTIKRVAFLDLNCTSTTYFELAIVLLFYSSCGLRIVRLLNRRNNTKSITYSLFIWLICKEVVFIFSFDSRCFLHTNSLLLAKACWTYYNIIKETVVISNVKTKTCSLSDD